MSFSVNYKELFKIDILHHFFLDKGNLTFDAMSAKEQLKLLDTYNFQDFLKVHPLAQTRLDMDGHHMVLSFTGKGFSVWTEVDTNDEKKPAISLSNDLSFTYLLKYTDLRFLNYTDLNLADSGKIYYFSNHRLNSEPGSFPLIPLKADSQSVDDSFILSEDSENEIIKKISVKEKENLFGIIRIDMKGDNNSHNITDAQGKIQDPIPIFKIEFENRKTTWRYLFEENQTVKNNDDVKKENGSDKILITKSEQPLTKTGFIEIELDGNELPNPDAGMIKPGQSNKIYSEIYM